MYSMYKILGLKRMFYTFKKWYVFTFSIELRFYLHGDIYSRIQLLNIINYTKRVNVNEAAAMAVMQLEHNETLLWL